ncbi:MAG: hypothetical protein HKP30_16390 [Myxococcales bacterium]|nr:hypothetical protein [Myxococcales bacterium]
MSRAAGSVARTQDRPDDWGEDRETVVAVFGDSARSGAWLPPERLNAIAGFGNVLLDFTDADLPPGPTEVHGWAVFGNVILRVPRRIDVELNGVSIFGSVKHQSDEKAGKSKKLLDRVLGNGPGAEAPPTEVDEDRWLVVKGWAVFGNIKVTVVDS